MATKAGLIGAWRIARRIENRIGPDARFEGVGAFEEDGEGLLWREEGRLISAGQGPMTATRQYLWRFVGDEIEVLFENGAPFHRFRANTPCATHFCDPDTYVVEYEFSLPLMWRAVWRVTGPAKDYVMSSEMTRRDVAPHK